MIRNQETEMHRRTTILLPLQEGEHNMRLQSTKADGQTEKEAED
jgi:hypothetical protein